jgi:hypothetical protein
MNVKQMYVCAGLSLLLVSSMPSHAMDRKATIGLTGLGAVILIGAAGWYYLKKNSCASTAPRGKDLTPERTGGIIVSTGIGSPRTGTQDPSPRTPTQQSGSPRTGSSPQQSSPRMTSQPD